MNLRRPSTGDLIAGISVAMVAIPQSLAYAELAGLPAKYGLFASALPSLSAAMFVSSRFLQTGPVALTALLTFGALTPLATPMTTEYIELAALLALLVGLMRLSLGVARLGRVAYLLSPPVLIGFTTAAALLIVSSQIPKVFDVEANRGGVLQNALDAIAHPERWRTAAVGFALGSQAIVFGGRRINRLFPGVLVAVLLGLAVSAITGYQGTVVGALDGGFVTLSLDFRWASVAALLFPAAAIALVGFAEPSAIARTYARLDRTAWDANRELVSQGVANLASAVSGAFPVGGSFSRSSLNRLAGATSAWAGAITGAFVLLAIPFTPALHDLPDAILGAIVIGAVVQLVDIRGFVNLRSQSWAHLGVGVFTMIITLLTSPHVERGVVAGVIASLVVARATGIRLSESEPAAAGPLVRSALD